MPIAHYFISQGIQLSRPDGLANYAQIPLPTFPLLYIRLFPLYPASAALRLIRFLTMPSSRVKYDLHYVDGVKSPLNAYVQFK